MRVSVEDYSAQGREVGRERGPQWIPVPGHSSVYHRWMVIALLASLLPVAASGMDDATPQFQRDVRPILAEHCFQCHGPDSRKRKAELRLDRADGQAVIVPGDPDASELVRRIHAADEDERMPPVGFGKPLSDADRDTLVRWIEAGAEWEGHWAYLELSRASSEDLDTAADPIDTLLDRRILERGVTPAPEADRRTLARRLHLDLLGLPPEPDEVQAFLDDEEPGAYERLVDRLLASPHYGERMATFWLDLVRYADTVGYHGDQEWRMWPYRDWVIQAFNQGMPFDQFTVEQLAGDLLPEPSLSQRVAAGYNRLNMVTFEGGSQAREFLAKYASDRVRTTAGAWLGSTMGCAECHDHKYDPFSTRDFYRFAAFFADIQEEGVYTRFQEGAVPPEMAVPSDSQERALAQLTSQAAWAERVLEARAEELAPARYEWESGMRRELASGGEPADVTWVDDEQANGGQTEGRWDFIDAAAGPVHSGTKSRHQRGAGIVQHFFLGAPRAVRLSQSDQFFFWIWIDADEPPETVMLQLHSSGSWEHRAYWGADRISFGGIGTDGPNHLAQGPMPEAGSWVRLAVDPAHLGLAPGSLVDGMAFTQFGGRAYWDRAGVRSARSALVLDGPPPEVVQALASAWERTPEQRRVLSGHWRTVAPELDRERAELKRLELEVSGVEEQIPKMLATVSVAPHEVRVLRRGNWMDDGGEIVTPGVPEFLVDLDGGDARATRLDLARWLVSAENPLTARVLANRLWRLYFGEGLARSVDDYGVQGELPDHPELLDRLAADLVDSGWDVKGFVRRLVTTRAYRRSSQPLAELVAADPENRLFARQNRRRLEAEWIRDMALVASGLLVREVGGPSVKPYQPAGYWAQLNFPVRTWQRDSGEALYRRGLYTFWCRTFLHPTLRAFDAPAREECTARRGDSNTPVQALALLNDPAFVEAARVLAQRVLSEGGETDVERLEWAFARVLSRSPHADEAAVLMELLEGHRRAYASDGEAAAALANEGDAPDPSSSLERAELAAWVSVTRSLLNLGEAISRR